MAAANQPDCMHVIRPIVAGTRPHGGPLTLVVVVVVIVVVLINLVVERPNGTIEQDNSKPQNNNRWIQNVRIERILYIQ